MIEGDKVFLSAQENDPAYACNEEALVLTRKGKLDLAEAKWDDCIQKFPSQLYVHLNRLHFYYVLDEYEDFKKKVEASSPNRNSPIYNQLLQFLHDHLRWEERVVLLDGLLRVKGWELYASEELAKYYFQQGNIPFSEAYWNQILEINPFHEEALFGMIEIQTQKEKWHTVLDYAKSISIAAKKNREFHYFLVKANFELGRYAEALKWIDSALPSEKSQISFLEVWRDCLLLSKDDPSWAPLLPYYRKAVAQGYSVPESVFFPTSDRSGKELRRTIRAGRQ